MIRPQVAQTVEALRRTLRSADIGAEDLDAVLLVGGSSRCPW
ncbi:MAG: Hsp70 family protein [Pseudonocardiaceae bacterium]